MIEYYLDELFDLEIAENMYIEKTISSYPRTSYLYAKYVIKDRFELGEVTIMNSVWKHDYERHVLGKYYD